MVIWGPLRGDHRHWYYETTDIAPYLKQGKNVLAVVVLNYGSHPPDAQLSVQTGFLLAADLRENRFINTPDGWKARHNPAYSPNIVDKNQVNGYYGGGSKEVVDGNKYLWGWEKIDYDDSHWSEAVVIEQAYAKSCKWASRWKLTPRNLPHEEMIRIRFRSLRKTDVIDIASPGFPENSMPVEIPAGKTVKMILDMGVQTTAYPVLVLSGGKNAEVKLTYVEAPYLDFKTKEKGNRNEIENKMFVGFFDKIIHDGGKNRVYRPMWWRAFRYVELSIETSEEALVLNDISAIYSSYPFEQKASMEIFDIDGSVQNQFIQQLFDIGHRTMKACSHEHFMDCPYYEESQFQGDARVEMLVSYYNYGDASLAKQGIELFSWSVNDEGFLSARYPTNSYYYIPNFSIYWIGMLYDYMMLYNDHEYIAGKLHIARYLLDYFERKENADGTLRSLDYHQFVDWTHPAGEPPVDENGNSSIIDMHYLLALQWAAALEKELSKDKTYFEKYVANIDKLKQAIRQKYWDEDLQLFTDLPGNKEKLSQHANTLAILTDLTTGDEASRIMEKVLASENMTKATLYWSFYVFEALQKAGLGNRYLDNLGVWKEVMDLGVTTWPETGPKSRSECHAWGSSPNYHLLKIVAGIQPGSPGLKTIIISPNTGLVDSLNTTFPHWMGNVTMSLNVSNSSMKATVDLPKGLTGVFRWDGREYALGEGLNRIEMP